MADAAGENLPGGGEEMCARPTIAAVRAAAQRYLAEAVGTAYLVAVISLLGSSPVVKVTPLAGPLAVGCALVALIYALGHVSSAHFNPAVTFVQLLRRDIGVLSAFCYVLAQLLGAFAGGLAGAAISGAAGVDYPKPADDSSAALRRAAGAEILFTSFMVSVILHVAAAPKQRGNPFFALAIAAVVVAGAVTTGAVSGAVFNPAVSSGLVLGHCCTAPTESCRAAVAGAWLFWAAPVAGALAGAGLFALMIAGDDTNVNCGRARSAATTDASEGCGRREMRSQRRTPTNTDELENGDNDDHDETVCLTVGPQPGREPLDPRAGQQLNCLRARVCQQPQR